MNKTTKFLIILVIVGVLGWLGYASFIKETGPTQPIKIGIIAPLTGKGASRGESVRQGLELAQEKIDKKIELIYQDVPLDKAKDAPAAFRQLTEIEKVVAIIGPMGSNVALAVTPLVDEKKVPLIIHAASALDATKDNEYVFRLWPTARSYVELMVPEIKKLGYQRIAVITATNDNTIDLSNVLKEQIGFIIEEQVSSDVKDFRTQLTKIKNTNPDVLFINLFEGQIGIAAKQARELGLTIPFFTNSVTSAAELAVGPQYLEGAWYPRFGGYGDAVKEEFIKKFGKEPANPESAAAAHDALLILAQAINEVGLSVEKIKDFIYANEFTGSIGKFRFLPSGDAEVPLSLRVIKNGQIVEQ